MSGSNVACLIPDRDSDSSDDEFLDALDAIENEPELEYAENVNTGLLVVYNFAAHCDIPKTFFSYHLAVFKVNFIKIPERSKKFNLHKIEHTHSCRQQFSRKT